MIKTLEKIRSRKERLGNEIILVELALNRRDLNSGRRALAQLGNTCDEIQEIIKEYLAFGEE